MSGPAAVAHATAALAGNFRPTATVTNPVPGDRSKTFVPVADNQNTTLEGSDKNNAIAAVLHKADTKSFGPSDFLNVNCESNAPLSTPKG